MSRSGTERIVEDLRRVVEDAETLLRQTSNLAGDGVEGARERAADSLRSARERLGALEEELLGKARDAARQADRYVRDNPWQSVGIAAGVGLILGVLISRR
jgi:ElaB/YqjD/DUF883 family membrane-anchored ribosome-binding protein